MPNQSALSAPTIDNPNTLDKIALFLLEEKDGRPRGFALQTVLEFVGTPTIFSMADAMGLLRGYLNLRQNQQLKGALMIITTILPFIPTGPAHYLIEAVLPTPLKPIHKPTTSSPLLREKA